jgi:hypothetical protein
LPEPKKRKITRFQVGNAKKGEVMVAQVLTFNEEESI